VIKYSFEELNHSNRNKFPMPVSHGPEINLQIIPYQPRSGTPVVPVSKPGGYQPSGLSFRKTVSKFFVAYVHIYVNLGYENDYLLSNGFGKMSG